MPGRIVVRTNTGTSGRFVMSSFMSVRSCVPSSSVGTWICRKAMSTCERSSLNPFGGSLTNIWQSLLFSSSQAFKAPPTNPHPTIPTLIIVFLSLI